MTARVATYIGGTIAIGSGFLSGVAIWLALSQPVTLATSGGNGVAALFRAFAGAAYDVAVRLLGYL